MRLSMDCKATVKIGDFSRGGRTRGDNQACDHDMGSKEKYVPCGIVDEDSGELFIQFGSSYKTALQDNVWVKSLPRFPLDSEKVLCGFFGCSDEQYVGPILAAKKSASRPVLW